MIKMMPRYIYRSPELHEQGLVGSARVILQVLQASIGYGTDYHHVVRMLVCKPSTMQLLIFALALIAARAQETTTIEASILNGIFGTPPTPLEEITIKPTDSTTTLLDKEGKSCQCVPYYLCDKDRNGVDINNPDITGWGELDIRFNTDYCQQSVEICCTAPRDPAVTPIPTPDPPVSKGCGYRNPKGISVTITGGSGEEAQFGEFPWVVALTDVRNDSYAGVGVLIHPQVVMTGAHIAYKYPPSALHARAGEWDTQTIKEILPFQEQAVQEMYIHKAFNNRSLKNDMALLKLVEPFKLAEHINVICLPNQDEMFDNSKNCVANGWGKNVFGLQGRYAVILKRVDVDMVPFSRCNTLLRRTRLGNRFNLHESFVCAGGKEGKDTCKGDGGAPLACPVGNGNDRYKLTGLVSWGIGCGEKDVPGVYANVAMFRQWIDDQMAAWGLDISGSLI